MPRVSHDVLWRRELVAVQLVRLLAQNGVLIRHKFDELLELCLGNTGGSRAEAVLAADDGQAAQVRRRVLAALQFGRQHIDGQGLLFPAAVAHVAQDEVESAFSSAGHEVRRAVLEEVAPLQHCVHQSRKQKQSHRPRLGLLHLTRLPCQDAPVLFAIAGQIWRAAEFYPLSPVTAFGASVGEKVADTVLVRLDEENLHGVRYNVVEAMRCLRFVVAVHQLLDRGLDEGYVSFHRRVHVLKEISAIHHVALADHSQLAPSDRGEGYFQATPATKQVIAIHEDDHPAFAVIISRGFEHIRQGVLRHTQHVDEDTLVFVFWLVELIWKQQAWSEHAQIN